MSGVLIVAGFAIASFLSAAPAHAVFSASFATTTTDTIGDAIAPADGLGLAPAPTSGSRRTPGRSPFVPIGGAGLGGVVLAGSVLVRRRGGGSSLDTGPLFVYVPGHGGDPDGFEDLAHRIGVEPTDVRVFDYRWAWASTDPVGASRWAPTASAADALGAYLAALDSDGRPIYLVGHSKGGAVITEVVARWDAQPETGVNNVVGATILDPPIATGPLGLLQSMGWFHGGTADDGLFDPVKCGWTGCRDVRDGLGERSGVEVVIVRNPDAVFTSFWGRPDDVRVYDLDDGSGSMLRRFPDVVGMWQRMGEAHNSVLHSDTVADCIASEAQATGSCRWPEPRSVETPWARARSGLERFLRW
ncbi:MAG: hypothetical protein U9N79_07090 [Actinomycetota bacterium]|nr:hypothetical protein [Actinomycetota bacterium]